MSISLEDYLAQTSEVTTVYAAGNYQVKRLKLDDHDSQGELEIPYQSGYGWIVIDTNGVPVHWEVARDALMDYWTKYQANVDKYEDEHGYCENGIPDELFYLN